MSAFYSFAYPDRVCVLTEGGFFDQDGVLRGIGRKIWISPELPVAITWRGQLDAVSCAVEEMTNFVDNSAVDTVDCLLDTLAAFFRDLETRKGKIDAEFLFAVWSEQRGPEHYFVQCHGNHPIPNFCLSNHGVAAQIGGGPDITWQDLAHLKLSADDIMSSNFPRKHGVDVMEAMRRKRGRVPGSDVEFFGVAGECCLTTVTAAGAVTTTLCTWPDEIGKPIDPTQGIASELGAHAA